MLSTIKASGAEGNCLTYGKEVHMIRKAVAAATLSTLAFFLREDLTNNINQNYKHHERVN